MTTTTLTIDSATYVQHGVSQPGMNRPEWAAQFKRLGGQRCTVLFPASNGTLPVAFEGTDEALAFLRASVVEVA